MTQEGARKRRPPVFIFEFPSERSRLVGFIGEGTLELDATSAVAGAPVIGRLNGKLLQTGCADLD